MQLHQVWRKEYRQRRYLEFVSSADLAQCIRDCVNNLVVLTPRAKIGVLPMDKYGQLLTKKFTHLLEEYTLRGEEFPYDLMRDHSIPPPLTPRRGKFGNGESGWANVLPNLPDGAIVKYGQLGHLQAALDGGGIRVCPASSYNDRSLDPHRYDNERGRPIHYRPESGTVHLVKRHDGRIVDPPTEIPIIGNVTITKEIMVDYYVWCASSMLAPRLFVDFDADACLIIRNRVAFQKRIAWALGMALRNLDPPLRRLSVQANHVRYYDPYDVPETSHKSIQVPWHKPLRYLYQREWRLAAFLEPPSAGNLSSLLIKPGPLADIAQIVYIGDLDGWRFPYRNAITPITGR